MNVVAGADQSGKELRAEAGVVHVVVVLAELLLRRAARWPNVLTMVNPL